MGAIETIIHNTAAAAQTGTAAVATATKPATETPAFTRTPTATPSPTATVLFLFPTNTQVVLEFPGGGTDGSDGVFVTSTTGPKEHDYTGTLACALVGQTPSDGTVFRPRQKFTVEWTVKNTGTAAWRKHTIDYWYLGGDKFHDRSRYDMNYILDPGQTIVMKVDMHAPKESGSYKTIWVAGPHTRPLCKMTLSIVVK